jgi:hypothetical protein
VPDVEQQDVTVVDELDGTGGHCVLVGDVAHGHLGERPFGMRAIVAPPRTRLSAS